MNVTAPSGVVKVTAANRERLWTLAGELDLLVLDPGGRFYFAKDSTLGRASATAFVGEERLRHFLDLKAAGDPDRLLQTRPYRRLLAA